jgi:DNA-binding transcriptional ArsR family regulator
MDPDSVFKAVADGTRRDIIAALAEGPLPVHALAARFAVTRPAISKHLRILGEAGLVRASRSGKENVYRLDEAPLRELAEWLGRFWSGRLLTLKQLAERKT